jgi:hypothetical protein
LVLLLRDLLGNGFVFVYLFWITLPASLMSESSLFGYKEFGVMPQTPPAGMFFAAFLPLIAILLGS